MLCCGSGWTSCFCCPTVSGSSSRSTDPTTTPAPTGSGQTPPGCADGARGDRELKLAGYEVFRFGATELQDREQARALLRQFFADLFRRFGVTPEPAGALLGW